MTIPTCSSDEEERRPHVNWHLCYWLGYSNYQFKFAVPDSHLYWVEMTAREWVYGRKVHEKE